MRVFAVFVKPDTARVKNMLPKKVIIVGYGSIGKRHARNILELGLVPYVVTRHPLRAPGARFFSSLRDIEDIGSFTHAVVASPTGRHLNDAAWLINAGVKNILIEKPLERSAARGKRILKLAGNRGVKVSVAYNMRYLGAFAFLRNFVKRNRKSIRVIEALAGQYLPDWRTGRNYADSYSAHRALGGGVDLDLSHEIDYLLWLFGSSFKRKAVFRAKISDLKTDAPDICKVILDYGRMAADVTLDCIRKPAERYLKIICEGGGSLRHDFLTNTLTTGGRKISFKDGMQDSYKKMMKAFLGIDRKGKTALCTSSEALTVLNVLGV